MYEKMTIDQQFFVLFNTSVMICQDSQKNF